MMRMRTKTMGMGLGIPPTDSRAANGGSGGGSGGGGVDGNWEMRPGGMLVQMRTDSDQFRPPPPTIRVRVKYGSVYHEINISSQASFGKSTNFHEAFNFIPALFSFEFDELVLFWGS